MKFKYNWSNYPQIKIFLIKIYNNSLIELKNNEYNENYAKEFLENIEDYLYYLRVSKYNMEKIIANLNKINCISFFNDNSFPPVINLGNKLLLNTNIEGNNRLNKEERRRLYLYYGLSNVILSFRNEYTKEFSKLYSSELIEEKKKTESLVNLGWLLLQTTISQELAERIIYDITGKQRPKITPGLQNETFPISENKVSSNLETNRVFQPITTLFGMTISNVGDIYNHARNYIDYNILKKAVNTNFSTEVISEYIEKGNTIELYEILYLMGILVNEKYHNYSLEFIKDINLSKYEIDEIHQKLYTLLVGLISFDTRNYSKVDIPKDEPNIFVKIRIKNFLTEYKI